MDNQQYINIINSDIVQRIEQAIKEFGPSPAEIATAVGAPRKDVGDFIRQHPGLAKIYLAEEDRIVSAIRNKKGLRTKVCKVLGVDTAILKIWESQNRRIRDAFDEASMARVDQAEENLDELLALQNWDATKFVLETQGKGRGYSKSPKSTLEAEADRLGISVTLLRDQLAERMVAQLMQKNDDELTIDNRQEISADAIDDE